MGDKGNSAEASTLTDLTVALQRHGMLIRGGFRLTAEDEQGLVGFPYLAARPGVRTLLLIGNAGPALYEAFFASGDPVGKDPLDDWTRRVIAPIAAKFDARALFPFGGPPWLPFQRWAMRAEGLKASPLGVLIHPEFGLWHAYRAALIFDQAQDLPVRPALDHPCDSCVARPCLTTCPAGAVTAAGYAVDNCAAHVASRDGEVCRTSGCLARRACPIGAAHRYPDRALAFHMTAFLRGRGGEISHPDRSGSVH